MCLPNISHVALLALSQEDRDALREFSRSRLQRAETKHAEEFWSGMVDAVNAAEAWQQANMLGNVAQPETAPAAEKPKPPKDWNAGTKVED